MENYLYKVFEDMDRLSPGSDETSMKAMALFKSEEEPVEILDVGCGKGADTFLLARRFPSARIRAIDINPEYADNICHRAEKYGLSERVAGVCMSMAEMNFEEESFDLIWAQGSIYAMGFKEGLSQWKKYLKSGGYIICSEVVWLADEPSRESVDFWKGEYDQIDTIVNKIKQIEEAGYIYQNSFVVKRSDWDENFYNPLMDKIKSFKSDHAGNEAAMDAVEMMEKEADFYNAHAGEYGYAFFSMVKP